MTGPESADELAGVDANIAAIQAALRQDGPGHPDHGRNRHDLGVCRMVRFALTGARADLDTAISDFGAAVAAIPRGDPYRAMALASLAGALTERFERTGQFSDLEAAVSAARTAVDAAPVGGEARPVSLATLGMALQAGYQRTGILDDLNASISQFQAAVDAVGQTGLGRAAMLGNLGMALRVRFERTSDPADLEAALAAGQAALAATPPDDPDRVDYLSNLGISFMRRFQRFGAIADAGDAITALRAAAAAVPPGHPHGAGIHSNLAVVVLARFLRTGDAADLDDAVTAGRIAVSTGDRADPRWAGMASNAGFALFRRYKRTGDPGDLDAAIGMVRASADATPPDHPDYAGPLTQLTGLLHARFERGGDPADLDGAIRAAYQALDATPTGHIERPNALVNLGVVLRSRFRLTGLRSDRDAALAALIQATEVTTAQTSVRARAAVGAGLLADDDRVLAARLLEDAVRLLAEAAPRQLARGDQQHAIGGFAGVAGAAASCALADPSVPAEERPVKALALLEASRAVLLSQALDTRDDLTDLRRVRPGLADRFVSLRDELDQPGPAVAMPGDPIAALGREAGERGRLAREFARTLQEIRALDGYASFGLPPSVGELLAEAAEGPVITFNVSADGGALLLTASGVSYVDLPGLTHDAVTAQVNAFHDALRVVGDDDRELHEGALRTLTAILEWLWDTAAGPVLDALGYRTPPTAGEPWQRVWWVPGGLLGLLPVHAAGYHGKQARAGKSAQSVLDRVVSSYTPTVRALRYARQQARHRDGPGRALVVAMPTTPGQRALPGVAEEVAEVCAVLPAPVVLTEPDDGDRKASPGNLPTRENVLRYLPACTIAHFACHAWSDAADPSRSLLVLHDHQKAPLTVAALAPVDHDRLELTYLSACSTAFTAARNLADEAIHLTSAFQLAGSRHVIGTLWPASDLVALRVATEFYAGLRTGDGTIDTDRAAVALHEAIRAVRDRWHADPSLWAPYLHAGA